MLRNFQSIGAVWVIALLTACGDGSGLNNSSAMSGQSAQPVMGRVESMTRRAGSDDQFNSLKSRRTETSPKPQVITLEAVSLAKKLAGIATESRMGVPTKIGFSRDLALTATPSKTAEFWHWKTTATGSKVAAISVTSTGAEGVRLGLLVNRIPWDAVMRFYAQNSSSVIEISGNEVMASIHRNIDNDGISDAAKTYWTPSMDGEESTIEIELTAGTSVSDLLVSIPRISNLVISPLKNINDEMAKIGQSSYCEIDISCTTGAANESNATAKMSFVASDGGSYVCSGTLLNDRMQSGTPYFLSANHCISLQSEASSLNTYWGYKSSSCNSGTLGFSKQLTGGATLLYANAATDTSFMRLNNYPPSFAAYAGWSPSAPNVATDVIGIHHPAGDLQKIAFGTLVGFKACTVLSTSDNFSCSTATQATGNFLSVQWMRGTTEGGSSGSGIYKSVGGSNYLIGQLYGGNTTCSNIGTNARDSYGRFDLAYTAALSKWLEINPRNAVYRFYNKTTGAHFFTISASERDFVIANYPVFSYEGPVFYAYATVTTGLSPVYRFYNTLTSSHFYTINASERDYVRATYPVFSYEGPVWYAQTTAGATTTPLYRFYNQSKGTHFYTVSASERDYIQLNYPVFVYEGTSYYAWSSLN